MNINPKSRVGQLSMRGYVLSHAAIFFPDFIDTSIHDDSVNELSYKPPLDAGKQTLLENTQLKYRLKQ